MGYKIGIGGVVTFKNSNLYKVVAAVVIKNILLETDSPYLTPVPYRGKENEPMYVEYVAKKICEIKQLDEASACRQIEENFNSIFD